MPESTKDDPANVVRGKQVPLDTRKALSSNLLFETPVGRDHRSSNTLDSSYLPPSELKDKILQMESVALPHDKLSLEIQAALPTMKSYFNTVALKEGQRTPQQEVDFDVQFIPAQVFDQFFSSIAAFFLPTTRKIYVRYPDNLNPRSMLHLLFATAHEFRHRIGKIRIEAIAILHASNETERLITKQPNVDLSKLHPPKWSGDERNFFEELFVIGWLSEHFREVLPKEALDAYCEYYELTQGLNPHSVQLNTAMKEDYFWDSVHQSVQYIWNGLIEEIHNLGKLMIMARSGKQGNAVPLIQAVTTIFGKEALLALAYTKFPAVQDTMEIIMYIFARNRTRKHLEELLKNQKAHGKKVSSFWQKFARMVPRRDLDSRQNSEFKLTIDAMIADQRAELEVETDKIGLLLNEYLMNQGYEGKPLP